MIAKHILNSLNHLYPFELAESWDNIGLLLGRDDNEITQVYLSLDVSSEVLEQVPEGSMLITHHPLIFKGLKEINTLGYEGKLIETMIKKDITYIALHTNYDNVFLNKYFIQKILGHKLLQKYFCF